MLALAVLTLSIFFTTRVRTGFVQRRHEDPDAEPHKTRLLYWLVGPAAAILAAVMALFVGQTGATWPESLNRPDLSGPIQTGRLAVFIAVPLLGIVLGSLLVRFVWWLFEDALYRPGPPRSPPPPTWPPPQRSAMSPPSLPSWSGASG